eukprot:100195-Hanusia_phi.AAC.2
MSEDSLFLLPLLLPRAPTTPHPLTLLLMPATLEHATVVDLHAASSHNQHLFLDALSALIFSLQDLSDYIASPDDLPEASDCQDLTMPHWDQFIAWPDENLFPSSSPPLLSFAEAMGAVEEEAAKGGSRKGRYAREA